MKFAQLYTKLFAEPCCVLPATHAALRASLLARLGGEAAAAAPAQQSPAPSSGPPIVYEPDAPGFGGRKPQGYEETMMHLVLRQMQSVRGDIGIISVDGVIGAHLSSLEMACGGCSLEAVRQSLDEAMADYRIRHIVLAFNSPGGSAGGVLELAGYLASLAKHTVAFTDSQMASAAYWLAAGCNEIFVTPTSDSGSIGVYIALLDRSVQLQMAGLKLELFKAGEYKALGLPGNPLNDSDRALLQARVDRLYCWFTGFVDTHRGQVPERGLGTDTYQGQTFDGEDAVARGLADGTVSDFGELLALIETLGAR
ncbi:MAG: S49 family peptidase [Verrucomicrobiales bacterium]|jgi:ClpP class serine protease|nr:S49 family peptidase [Verrucomicrobiales bacterium]